MDRYFKYFKIPFIITAVIAVVCIVITVTAPDPAARNNTETDLTGNVFDYAGNLTDAQVSQLDAYITEIEEKTKIDIAIVILNESLADSGLEGGYSAKSGRYDMYVKGFADMFADVHRMGYEKPLGSNLVFVDNVYREPTTGRVDSWISTYGEAKQNISQSDCEAIMDDALYSLNDYSDADDYYSAYRRVVELVPNYASSFSQVLNYLRPVFIIAFAFAVAVIYVLINWKSKAGDKTTSGSTYLVTGRPNFRRKQDVFLRKSVTKVKIQSSSSSGGGGGHGGGGHSR